jgi:DNA-binding response OmpR family regulator
MVGSVQDENNLRLSSSPMPGARTILLVDDDVDLRRLFRTALAFSGFRILEAGDGLHALHILDTDPPDLVVLDLGLPVVSGHVVRQEIAAHAHLRDIRVVVVTGEPGPHHGMNVACVLRKPVTAEQLIHTVRTCLASGHASPI